MVQSGAPHAMRLIPPRKWNAVARKILRKHRVSYTGGGDGRGWSHPWRTAAQWSPVLRSWGIQIAPAFVNAAETELPRVPAAYAPVETRTRLDLAPDSRERVSPWLSERPWIPVTDFREIGTGTVDLSPEPVPKFFQTRGVQTASQIQIDDATGGVSVVAALPVPPERRRFLRAVDIVLRVPKPTVAPVLVEAGGRTAISLEVQLPTSGPSLSFTPRYVPQPPPPSLQEQLITGRVEDPYVERHVSTLYLLSPPGVPPGTPIAGDWQAFAKHRIFWNLAFSWKLLRNDFEAVDLSFPTGLAGGIADLNIGTFVDDLIAQDEQASLLLTQAAILTRFHTL